MTQIIDFRFELLFFFCIASSLVLLLSVFVLKVYRRNIAAGRLVQILGVAWAGYLSAVIVVAAASPQRIIARNQDLCSDDMCFAVVKLVKSSNIETLQAKGIFYIVTVRVSNRGRGRAQSEGGLYARLWSPDVAYEVSQAGQIAWNETHAMNKKLTVRLWPGDTTLVDQVFDVPPRAAGLHMTLSNGFTPGYFVIGECPLFHKPAIFQLP